jgi:hypothetical protein
MKKKTVKIISMLLAFMLSVSAGTVLGEPVVARAAVSSNLSSTAENTLRNYNIPLQDGSSMTVADISEDYVAFIFGRTTCPNCNAMTSALDLAQKQGISIHKVFVPIDETDTSTYAQNHPGTMTIARFIKYTNSNLAYSLCNQTGLQFGTLPAFFILDKNRKLVWASTENESSELYKFFGFKGVTDVDLVASNGDDQIHVGDTFKLSVVPTPLDGLVFGTTFSSSDDSVLKVEADGSCTALKEGYCSVLYTVEYYGISPFFGDTENTVNTMMKSVFFTVYKKTSTSSSGCPDGNCNPPATGSDDDKKTGSDTCTDPDNCKDTETTTGANTDTNQDTNQDTNPAKTDQGNNTSTSKAVKKPKATKITSVKKAKKQFTVNWKKISGVKGYQLQYSTSSKFKNAKNKTYSKASATKATIKKLKSGKTYYVRVRTYKVVNGEKVYSGWTKTSKIKVK